MDDRTGGDSDRSSGDRASWVSPEEHEAIVRCQRGDRAAFEIVVRLHMRRASAFALAWTGSPEDALDLSQEAFARALAAIRRFDAQRPFYPWLHTILRNLCRSHLGRASRRCEVPFDNDWEATEGRPGPDAAVESAELRLEVWNALGRLSSSDREILILREFQGLSYARLAETLGIPAGTVMSRLHQARVRMRRELAPYLAGSPRPAAKGGTPTAAGGEPPYRRDRAQRRDTDET